MKRGMDGALACKRWRVFLLLVALPTQRTQPALGQYLINVYSWTACESVWRCLPEKLTFAYLTFLMGRSYVISWARWPVKSTPTKWVEVPSFCGLRRFDFFIFILDFISCHIESDFMWLAAISLSSICPDWPALLPFLVEALFMGRLFLLLLVNLLVYIFSGAILAY